MKKTKHIMRKKSLWGICLAVLACCGLLYVFLSDGTGQKITPIITDAPQETTVPDDTNVDADDGGAKNAIAPMPESKVAKGDFTAKLEDERIVLKWDLPAPAATLVIKKEGRDLYSESVSGTGEYTFTEGVHGTHYIFILSYYIDGKTENLSLKRLFLDFDKLPSLLTLYINTKDGHDPFYKKMEAPNKELFGTTITNNDYKNAVMNNDIPLRVKVRGNFSAYGPRKSYKLVFDEPRDMLDLGKEYADKEWLLLGKDPIQTYFGFKLGVIAGMEWEPRMRFVNLMMNGDWKGLYILCESVKKHPKRVDLDEDGFLIESDGYYWKEKRAVLDSDLLSDKVKFTFKYPKPDTTSDAQFLAIEKRIHDIEDAIKNHDEEKLAELIDFDMFASWLIAHEIMGTNDGYGSNKFFYQKNMRFGTKLKMGPVWDFDSMFLERYHSKFWTNKSAYFPLLLEFPSFNDVYKQKYATIAATVEDKVQESLQELKNIQGFAESMSLNKFMGHRAPDIDTKIDTLMKMLHNRIEELNLIMK